MTGPERHDPPKISREWHPYVLPWCDSMWTTPDTEVTFTCTRKEGHPGQHEAGTKDLGDGSFEVVATWP